MNKLFKSYMIIWAILLALFNVIVFVGALVVGGGLTVSFWIGYIFIMLAFGGNLFCTNKALKADGAKKLFYNIPVIRLAYGGLISSFIIGGLCMLISEKLSFVGVIVCAVILAAYAVAVVKSDIAAETVQETDEKIQSKTQFIRSIAAEANILKSYAVSDTAKTNVKKVYEAFRYSDPMSNEALSGIENEINDKYAEFEKEIRAQKDSSELADVICRLVSDRNAKCRVMK